MTQPSPNEVTLSDADIYLCLPDSGRFDAIEFGRAVIKAYQERRAADEPVAKYDDVLIPFLALMRIELHANSDKGDRPGWLSMSPETALLEIYWHTAKLSAAVKNDDTALITEHAADVANMAMMLLDVCGALAPTAGAGDQLREPGAGSVDPVASGGTRPAAADGGRES